MKAMSVVLLVCLVTLGIAIPALAGPDANPNFVTKAEVATLVQTAIDAKIATGDLMTKDQVSKMIAEALAGIKKPVEPPINFVIGLNDIGFNYDGTYSIWQNVDFVIPENLKLAYDTYPTVVSCWGVAHLPTVDYIAFNINYNWADVNWYCIPSELMPTPGSPIPVEIYIDYAGKTWHLETTITNWE